MEKWLSSQQLAEMISITDRGARKIIASGQYNGVKLITRQVKSKKGKPTYQVLWNTEANQPATTEGEYHVNESASDRRIPQDAAVNRTVNPGRETLSKNVIRLPQPNSHALRTVPTAEARQLLASDAHAVQPDPARPHTQAPVCRVEAMPAAEISETAAETPEQPESPDSEQQEDKKPGFEDLLKVKLKDKPASTQRSLRAYYRRLYKETGEVPIALMVDDGRRYSGKKSSLDQAIQSRFIDMVMKAADASDIFSYYTQDQRKVTVFHLQLEQEFGRNIPINQLYTIVRACNLKQYLEMPDGEDDEAKTPGFFKSEPVASLVQVDGVEADYVEIRDGDHWRKPIWIEFMDFGSRRLLAMHAYFAESNENSVDIFIRFLLGNEFPRQHMKIRPDNAKGFLNLKRPVKEMNNRYAAGGFLFMDDFSRAGTPKDKAHLESSHRVAHKSLERGIIEHFKDRIDSQYQKQKKVGNKMKTVTVTRLAISLDELNACGQTEAYRRRHNEQKHRFTEDGVQRTWIPEARWREHLAVSETFRFKPADVELCRVYGYTKHAATIAKDGTITFQKRKYFVANTDHWSRSSSTKVKVSLIGEELAYFSPHDEGTWLGTAKALQAPVKPEKLIEQEKAKVIKIQIDNEFAAIVNELRRAGMIVNETLLRKMLADGLTLDGVTALLAQYADKYQKVAGTIGGFNMFNSHVKTWLSENCPKKLIPYAGVSENAKKD